MIIVALIVAYGIFKRDNYYYWKYTSYTSAWLMVFGAIVQAISDSKLLEGSFGEDSPLVAVFALVLLVSVYGPAAYFYRRGISLSKETAIKQG